MVFPSFDCYDIVLLIEFFKVFIEINLLFVLYLDKLYCDYKFIYLIYYNFLSLGTDVN